MPSASGERRQVTMIRIGMRVAALLTFLILTVHSARATDLCTPELIKALRTTYSFTDKTAVAELTQQIACSKDQRSVSVDFQGLGFSSSDVRSACSKNDRAFFQRNAKVLSLSFLPTAAIEKLSSICASGPNNLTLQMQGSQDNQIIIEAKWSAPGTSTHFVVVDSFSVSGPAECPPNGAIRPGSKISEGGVAMVCIRKGDGNVIAIVNTKNNVTKFASASRLSKPKIDLVLLKVDDVMTCKLNGAPILGLRIFQAPQTINLNGLLRPGTNELVCEVVDTQDDGHGRPCWGYALQVLQNGVATHAPSFHCCESSPLCNKRAAVIQIPIENPIE
jgi:hypothetical protein